MIVDFLTFIPRKIAEAGSPILSAITSILIFVGMLAIKNRVLGGSWNFIANSIARATAQLAAWKAANAGGVPTATPTTSGVPGTSPASGATGGFLANSGNMLRAAGAMLIFAAAIFVLAKALQEFSSVEWEGMKKALVSVSALIALSFLLQNASPAITSGVFVIALMSGSLLLLGLALQMFSKVDWKLVAGVGIIILGLGLAIAGFGAAVSGPQSILLGIGIGIIVAIGTALMALGIALTMIVAAIRLAGPALTNLADSFKALFEIKDLKENFSNLESFLSQLSSIDIDPINNLANAIYNLATNLEALAAIPSKMGINVTGKTDLTETINKTVANAAEATTAISKATTAATSQALIPAQQTTAFVPLVVQIDKQTVIEILKKDIEGIAKGQALDTLDAVGIVQSGYEVINRVSANKTP